MFCCGTKQRKSLLNENQEKLILQESTQFNDKQISELRQQFQLIEQRLRFQSMINIIQFKDKNHFTLKYRFMHMSNNTGFLTNTQFRDCMGILGLANVQFLSDRIFNVMANPNGQVIK